MNERRILADIERHLARDDPELLFRTAELNRAMETMDEDAPPANEDSQRRKGDTAFIVAVLVMIVITALLTVVALSTGAVPAGPSQAPTPTHEPASPR